MPPRVLEINKFAFAGRMKGNSTNENKSIMKNQQEFQQISGEMRVMSITGVYRTTHIYIELHELSGKCDFINYLVITHLNSGEKI